MKIEYYVVPRKIRIDLPFGCYTLSAMSGTGKTYLFKTLEKLTQLGKSNALCLTYDVRKHTADYVNDIRNYKGNLICVDRFDRYYKEEICDALNMRNQSAIILVDLKAENILTLKIERFAFLSLEEEEIYIR